MLFFNLRGFDRQGQTKTGKQTEGNKRDRSNKTGNVSASAQGKKGDAARSKKSFVPFLTKNCSRPAKELAKWTLTNLYNQRPACLDHAHRRLDEAVFAAYGWPPGLTDEEILAKLLQLNLTAETAR